MMDMDNYMEVRFPAVSENEGLARLAAAAFVMELDPFMDELSDIKTAVSEAVTNAIIHGYDGEKGEVILICACKDNVVYIEVRDKGRGIENIKKAMEPMFTTKPSAERTGLGFTIMQSFMDEVTLESEKGKGTTVKMNKTINKSL